MNKCPKCGIVFRPEEKALWCPVARCPETEQRRPTEEQEIQFGMKEEK
jgi:hypothetical protein